MDLQAERGRRQGKYGHREIKPGLKDDRGWDEGGGTGEEQREQCPRWSKKRWKRKQSWSIAIFRRRWARIAEGLVDI